VVVFGFPLSKLRIPAVERNIIGYQPMAKLNISFFVVPLHLRNRSLGFAL